MSQIATQEAVESWKIAHRFVLDVYKLTNRLPKEEHYGLIPKVRTSSVKIASNIVEGYARKSPEFYMKHLSDSQVALEETKYSLLVARDLGYISNHQYDVIMRDAEGLSDRLEGLKNQLGGAEPDGAPQNARVSGWFATTHGVKDAWHDSIAWLQGGRAKLQARRRERNGGNMWVEDPPATSYLESPDL